MDDGGQLGDDEVQGIPEEDLDMSVWSDRHRCQKKRTKSALSVT